MHTTSSVEHYHGLRTSLSRIASRSAVALGVWYAASGMTYGEEPEPTPAPVAFDELDAASVSSIRLDSQAEITDGFADPNSNELESLEPISSADDEPDLATDSLPIEDEAPASDTTASASQDNDDELQFGAALTRVAREAAKGETRQPILTTTSTTHEDARLDQARAKIARFNGLQPGTSTLDDVFDGWSEPAEKFEIEAGWVLIYDTKPFRQIEVVVKDDVVHTIKIELEEPLSSKRLVEQLGLDTVEPADVLGEDGQVLGQIFPERGVLFMFTGEGHLARGLGLLYEVEYIVIQPLDAAAFTLRAENQLHGPYERNLRDLELALALEPDNAHAHWLLAAVYLETGQVHQAQIAAGKALELDPSNDAYRLRWARVLEVQADYDQAVHETREVLDSPNAPQAIKAQALHQMGRLATLGDHDIRSKAIPFYTKAIEIADALATSNDAKERRAAKELLVDAHLSVAREIAAQDYNNKLDSISQWITRASGLAEDAIANDNLSPELRLRVAEASLAALAELKPTRDPGPWIVEAQSAAEELMAAHDDTLWKQHVQWELGVAYFHAIRIEHTRRQTATALKYGEKAIDCLAEGAKSREAVPDSEHLVGRLYFHIGALHAVHEKDHDAAVVWYEKAMPLLTSPVPVTQLAVPRRHGEALVSMGVTYWQLGQRDKALELTRSGADQIEKAVQSGVLDQDALAVPYGNLATMHKDLGNREEGNRYANLAQNARAAGRVEVGNAAAPPHRTARGPMSPGGNAMRRTMPGTTRMSRTPQQQSTTSMPNNGGGNTQRPQRRNVAQRQPTHSGPSQQSSAQPNQLNIHPELRGN